MSWAEALPNLLICLREGLEAGLVVTILLAAVRKASTAERPLSATPVWLGLLGAVSVAASFAAVLTYSTSVMSSSAQETVGGVLSVLAVALVTWMVFWMRRTASTLSKQLRGEVTRAAAIGAGALAVTAFLAVGREGLETTLFVWTAVKASGTTLAPLVGATIGLIAAVVLCWLLYRQSVRLNLGVFFSRTALLLIVIAAGVLAYGLGELQNAGVIPGAQWIAFDWSAHIDANSWWASLITGITALQPKMTVLQVVAWAVYLVVVLTMFVRAGATAPKPAAPKPEPAEDHEHVSDWFERIAGKRLAVVSAALVLVPALAAGLAIALLPSASEGSIQAVSITSNSCAPEWGSARSGSQTFSVKNDSGKAGEITLVNADGAIVGEIETIGAGTTADMTATLSHGSYTIKCAMSGQAVTTSATVQVSGTADAPPAVKPVTQVDLKPANDAYQAAAAQALGQLTGTLGAIRNDLHANNIAAAQADWLTAQEQWERVGASYNSFGDKGTAVDGLPGGLPDGVNDDGFTGLHRLEYGLWHGQGAAQLLPVLDKLGADIAAVQQNLTSTDLAGDPTNLPIRGHEILEDALRDHISGMDDLGGGAAYPLTMADIDITRTVISGLGPLLDERAPDLRPLIAARLDTLQRALLATQDNGKWRPPAQTPHAAQQSVKAALGGALEVLARVPRLLEVPAAH
ncbi:iron uptake transporter permease EfeU [Nocardia sp. NPDC020380]|uniref:iron uptake transporter permease EfeU n=1 Tax=Nocardia sp. NPDC020380 TaxID=3364309 RepID=UPI0037A1346D